MKIVKILLILLVVLVVALAAVSLRLGPIVKTAVEKFGPPLVGVPLSLGKADVSLWSGRVYLKGLVIGNPDGFGRKEAISLGTLKARLTMRSLFSRRILVREILIDAPDITYEQTLSGSNLAKIEEQLSGTNETDKSGRKVEITRLRITNGKIRYSAPGMRSAAIPIPLPTIELNDIGKESGGASLTEVVANVLSAIVGGAVKAVGASGQLIGDGAKTVGKKALKGAEAVGDKAKNLLKSGK